MTDEIKEFIEKHIMLIENDDFQDLYKALRNELNWDGFSTGELTSVLWKVDIHPERTLIQIPNAFAYACQNVPQENETVYFYDLQTIGESAFSYSNIQSIDLSNTKCQKIENKAFALCSDLVQVCLPNSLRELASGCFSYCRKLTSVKYSGTKKDFKLINKDNTWRRESGIKEIICSDGILRFK